MKLANFAVISAIICLQVRGDELDVMHDKYQAVLDGLLSKTLEAVDEARQFVNYGETEVTIGDEVDEVAGKKAQIKSAAADVALDAITNSKNVSVVTCTSIERENGIRSLDDLQTAYVNSLNQEAAPIVSSFSTLRSTVALIASQLTGLYNKNAANLASCVDELCFQLNNATATSQFTNVKDGLTVITNTVVRNINQYDDISITLFGKIGKDSQSALDAAVKAMGQC